MSRQADDHRSNVSVTPAGPGAPLRPKKPWRAPLIITASTEDTAKLASPDEVFVTPDLIVGFS